MPTQSWSYSRRWSWSWSRSRNKGKKFSRSQNEIISVSQHWFRATTGKKKNTKPTHLHLLVPTLEEPANQGSKMKMHRKVSHRRMPRNRAGLSLKRSPFRNQWTVCFRLEDFRLMVLLSVLLRCHVLCGVIIKFDWDRVALVAFSECTVDTSCIHNECW